MPSFVTIPKGLKEVLITRLDFRGGLNNGIVDEFIAPNELSLVENYIPDIENAGAIIKREGITRASSVQTEAVTSVFQGKNADYFSTTTTLRNFAGTALASGLTAATTPDWETFVDNDIYVDGINAPQTSTNGTTFANLGGTPPTFKYMRFHNHFLFGAGHSLGVLRWADLGTAATWTAANALNITNDANDDITGLARYAGRLIVFCAKSFHHVHGEVGVPDMTITYSNYRIGSTSHRAIISTPFALFWWTRGGIAMSRDGVEVIFPSVKAYNLGDHTLRVDRLAGTYAGLNKNQYGDIHGAWNEKMKRVEFYVFSGASQTTPNIRIDYYYEEDSFWIQNGIAAQMGASGRAVASGDPRVYVGSAGPTNSYLYYQNPDVATDDGVAIPTLVEMRRESSEYGPVALKYCKQWALFTVLAANATFQMGIYVNDAGSPNVSRSISIAPVLTGFVLDTSLLDTGVLGAGTVANTKTEGIGRRFYKMKTRLSESNAVRVRIRGIVYKGHLVAA